MNEYKQIIVSIAAKPYCHFVLAIVMLSCPLLFVLIPVGEYYDIISMLISGTRIFAFLLMASGVYMIYNKSIVKKYKDIEFEYKDSVRDLKSTSWENFKKLVVFYFRKMSFVVKFANDKYSFIAELNEFIVLVDCKHWDKEKVTYHDVVSVYEKVKNEKYNMIYVVSKGLYSERAQSFAFDKRVKLISGYQLVEWMKVVNE